MKLVLGIIAVSLSSFSIGVTAGRLLYAWQEKANERNNKGGNGND